MVKVVNEIRCEADSRGGEATILFATVTPWAALTDADPDSGLIRTTHPFLTTAGPATGSLQ